MRGPKLFRSRLRVALQERLHERVDLVDAADVLDVGVDLVAQAEVERQVGPHAPVVLDEDRRGSCCRRPGSPAPDRACRCAASPRTAGRHRPPGRRRCDRSSAKSSTNSMRPCRNTPRSNVASTRCHSPPARSVWAPRTSVTVSASWNRFCVGALRHAERGPVLHARERQLRADGHRLDLRCRKVLNEADVSVEQRRATTCASRCRRPTGSGCWLDWRCERRSDRAIEACSRAVSSARSPA